ncbi:amidohydrolase [Bradyrhizobium sp. U87765 SZCCT0131]|uniref:M20 aminoacylase family protein n=1 Tax=unclassified Bradyrhizobium TaxID=2631580 RepID=UPI001BAC16ED|nr:MULTISPECIES: M20 aminoacylase family protein [unclassified Bradyrhizobium]MBR1221759.1 amidohydrolase [Bradyrhizobium sp. U87765 SZCCT0131]MBR1264318.1 amidohydrolase [Bradyrhizobium sp. U87765 SZCCT0134]MBR1304775.1 amidohydrolase [Bradyrhizobium sp. U87765 SZCCT0110]MBR1324111.1 amidohydrolase [Bradyrhizobium sp. U87765 SZCCT0109]MBR1346704.1 amidohydrolase [Bradyrhizobium sp. U87765 SZCCT0048]
MDLIPSIVARHAEMTAWRRQLHARPEIGFEEVETAAFVADRLRAAGIAVHTGLAGTGVVGVIEGRPGSRSIGLRADMDALPMDEAGDRPWRSTIPGRFHGCGHDGHTVMLLAAALHLAATRDFDGRVVVVFQPAEEGLGGGRVMVEAGLFERFPCDEIYALHNMPLLPFGQASVRPGPALASFDRFEVTIRGVGGHAAMPHKTIDPGLTMAHVVVALQALVARNTDPLQAAVLSVTQMNVGTTHNVIASEARFAGTVRALDEAARAIIEAGFSRTVQHVAQAYGAQADIAYIREYPVLINDAAASRQAGAAIEATLGRDGFAAAFPPLMAAEDFAFMLQQRPGAYLLVGQGTGPESPMVHHPAYDFNDDILPIGASLLCQFVELRGVN